MCEGECVFLTLSKVFGFFLQPSSFLFLLLPVGLGISLTRWKRTGGVVIVFAIVCLIVLGFSPVARLLILPLEQHFSQPPMQFTGPEPTGIVVLGGALESEVTKTRGLFSFNAEGERFTEAATLARRFPQARLVISTSLPGYDERAFMKGLGIAEERVIVERPSSNTHENAVYGKKVAQPKPGERWLLVTSAVKMPRAIGCFRKVGFDVEPWPVDYRTAGWSDAWRFFDQPGVGLNYADLAVKEWIGLVVYWLTGRTSSLFPGP